MASQQQSNTAGMETFGIPNVDTESPDYDPRMEFETRFDVLGQLANEDVGFAGRKWGENVQDLASFAGSALRAGIEMIRREGGNIDDFLATAAEDVVSRAIMAALTDYEVRDSIAKFQAIQAQVKERQRPADGMTRTISARPNPSMRPSRRPRG